MKATLIQMDIKWCDIRANIAAAERLMLAAERSDLYVLPEMFTTGFVTAPAAVAEPADGETLAWMQRIAHTLDAAVAGSVAVRAADGSFRNRLYFVKPDGTYCHYDKRHLFTYGDEDKTYTCGEDKVTVEWRGVRFLLQVCYDLRFPVFSRNVIVDGVPLYGCCIYVASWPDSRRRVWDTLLYARAIENQCYVLGVNRVGEDIACRYDGGTVAVDAYGRDVAVAHDCAEETVTVELDIDKLASFRKKFPVLKDADTLKA